MTKYGLNALAFLFFYILARNFQNNSSAGYLGPVTLFFLLAIWNLKNQRMHIQKIKDLSQKIKFGYHAYSPLKGPELEFVPLR